MTKEEYTRVGSVKLGQQLERQLQAEGRDPVVIPVGGSNSLGTWGYLEATAEVEQQIGSGGFTDIAMVCPLPRLAHQSALMHSALSLMQSHPVRAVQPDVGTSTHVLGCMHWICCGTWTSRVHSNSVLQLATQQLLLNAQMIQKAGLSLQLTASSL